MVIWIHRFKVTICTVVLHPMITTCDLFAHDTLVAVPGTENMDGEPSRGHLHKFSLSNCNYRRWETIATKEKEDDNSNNNEDEPSSWTTFDMIIWPWLACELMHKKCCISCLFSSLTTQMYFSPSATHFSFARCYMCWYTSNLFDTNLILNTYIFHAK